MVRHLPLFSESTSCSAALIFAGRLFLSCSSSTVEVFDPSTSNPLTRYGTLDEAGEPTINQPAQFSCPYGIAVDETRDRLYVADMENHCVVAIRLSDGLTEAVWGSEGSNSDKFRTPCSSAYCPTTDLLYVADSANNRVKVMRGADGECVQVLSRVECEFNPELNEPQGVAVDNDHVYIADTGNHRVVVFSKHTGRWKFQLGEGYGGGNRPFCRPCGLSVDSKAGVVYVADSGNRRVCVYRSVDGGYMRHFEVVPQDNSEARPVCVWWDAAAGVLYLGLSDSTSMCVYECSS
eukprot:TRINITY_DN6217_c0_g1_i3.p1 TRINITY_DN6217_c0_g1~~TRINITY_DN6217_c0_g1_i3.p1  ORF type:complete len:292 (+),score=0.73 TRINITY_DN6217_c0_g1_i3:358-1233(+)